MDMDKLMARITIKEGDRLFAYDDKTGKRLVQGMTLQGNLTIGRGRNLSGKGITEEESAYLERNDLNEALAAANREPWWPRVANDDVRARAFVELIFNLGAFKLHEFHKAMAAAVAGDWKTCAAELMDSPWHTQVGQRAAEIEYMIETGVDV